MLPRASLLLVAVGVTVVATASYNTDYGGTNGRNDRYDRNNPNYPSNNPNYDRRNPYDPNYNQNNYNQNSGSYNYNRNSYDNRQYNEYNKVYTKNETAIFCYINATRLDESRRFNSGPSMDIEPRLCTHLIIGAAIINPNSHTVRLLNEEILTRQELKRENPNLKVLLSIHGSSMDWANMVKSQRDIFIKSIIDICGSKNVGVNIDWQWPERKNGHDVDNFFQFLLELKNELRRLPYASHELTVFLPAEYQQLVDILQPRGDNRIENLLMQYVDYWILMALELRGHWDQRIEHHAPIDSYIGSRQTVRKAINEVRGYVRGEYLYKFILAIPFYGKRYQLAARADRESPMNKLQQTLHTSYDYDGIMRVAYNKVCQEITGREFQLDYDETNGSPYAYHDNTVFVYEDTRSVKAKTRLALQNGFGGVMAYSIEMDDATGQCGQSRRTSYDNKNSYNSYSSNSELRFPLLNAIKDQVTRGHAAQFHSSPLAIILAVICVFILKVNN
ncbi:putative chitinase 2 isoform X2 [Phymastichus coffea]|uniref:putative chitinase 2 isoform X2 n=1 Tax=Phymastichus coffea TaxID=108790 RepID=UPI00273B5342|nr:putative chitinase 2 isoform X2 [Phymastichus coffea]